MMSSVIELDGAGNIMYNDDNAVAELFPPGEAAPVLSQMSGRLHCIEGPCHPWSNLTCLPMLMTHCTADPLYRWPWAGEHAGPHKRDDPATTPPNLYCCTAPPPCTAGLVLGSGLEDMLDHHISNYLPDLASHPLTDLFNA